MKKLFIHNPIFRIVSPLFSGSLVYALLLLISNNLTQLLEQFLEVELFFCVFLSYLSHEFSRFALIFFGRIQIPGKYLTKLLLQISSTLIFNILLVSVSVYFFYLYIVGFSANSRDFIVFNLIFTGISSSYITLHLSHQFLYNQNTKKLSIELKKTEQLETDFRHFKQGLNPTLLFESLESLLILLQEGSDPAEEFLDQFASVYRYILSTAHKELFPFKEEEKSLHALIILFEHLPFRKTKLHIDPHIQSYVVPGSILQTLELIIRSSISSTKILLTIHIKELPTCLEISYRKQEKILGSFTLANLEELQRSYSFYSEEKITMLEENGEKKIRFPLLFAYNSELQQAQSKNSI